MTVRELLSTVDSFELSEWIAYEKAFGPLGNDYTHEVLASMHELQQALLHLYGAQLERNPIPVPKRFPRPDEAFQNFDLDYDPEVVSQAEFDTQF